MMSTLEHPDRQRDALPSINHLELDKFRSGKGEQQRFPIMTGLSVSTAPLGSPTTIYSGPPPPYSSAASATGSAQGLPGYISPPDTNSRRSTRDDKDSPIVNKFLPSISEALKNADMASSAPTPTSQPNNGSNSAPGSAAVSTFAEAPRGPGNPFSQPTTSSTLRTSFSSNSGAPDPPPVKSVPQPMDSRLSHSYAAPPSPHTRDPVQYNQSNTSHPYNAQQERPIFRSPFEAEPARHGYPFQDPHTSPQSATQPSSSAYPYGHHGKFEDQRPSFGKDVRNPNYGETVKRHLDIFDAELALNEIADASSRTFDFSKVWIQRYHQSNRTSYFSEGLPNIADVEDMMRQSHRLMDSLSRIREVVVMQQTALDEQRARTARGPHPEDEYHNIHDEFKNAGMGGPDAKKRRGKAAPPGRCHSCNRAETPEWRRGPDGARTLCNACGLHYAKLTRKMGANKAAVLTGSNLRPKNIHDTRP